MERLDFYSFMTIVSRYLYPDQLVSQTEKVEALFSHAIFNAGDEVINLDKALLSTWFKGTKPVSPRIIGYYTKLEHHAELAESIRKDVLPYIYDLHKLLEEMRELLGFEQSISEQKRQELLEIREADQFLAQVLVFAITRNFVKRESGLVRSDSASPSLKERVIAPIPRPCGWFVGREREMQEIESALNEYGILFLNGIPGIGKSETAKAYAHSHRKPYTNLLYLPYQGSFRDSLLRLTVNGETGKQTEEDIFQSRIDLLRQLKKDSLLLVDNCNVTIDQDEDLNLLRSLECHVLITTRTNQEDLPQFQVKELPEDDLFTLMSRLYPRAERYENIIRKVISQLHCHTLNCELAARLLKHNPLLNPLLLLKRLEEERIPRSMDDRLNLDKDGRRQKATYYQHMAALFAMGRLGYRKQTMMKCLTLTPESGISVYLLCEWLKQTNLNLMTELVEIGYVQQQFFDDEDEAVVISLHPMIRDMTLLELPPTVTDCKTMLGKIQERCIIASEIVPEHQNIFQTVEQILSLIQQDDKNYYLRFLVDLCCLLEKYEQKKLLNRVLCEMQELIQQGYGTYQDRCLFYDYSAGMEENAETALELEQKALAELPQTTAENAILKSNILSNLAGLCNSTGQMEMALNYAQQGIEVLKKFDLLDSNVGIAQGVNYGMMLVSAGQLEQALEYYDLLKEKTSQCMGYCCFERAAIEEAKGNIYNIMGQQERARGHYLTALSIYHQLWKDMPEQLEQKRQELHQALGLEN